MNIPNIREPVKECCGTQLGTYYSLREIMSFFGIEIEFVGTFVPHGENQNDKSQ